MKTFVPGIATCAVLLCLTLSCRGPLPYDSPFAMADGFTEAFAVKVNPKEMEKYCDPQGAAYLDTAFYAVERRSPQMFGYLVSWTRSMRFTWTRNPAEVPSGSVAASATGDASRETDEAIPSDTLGAEIPPTVPPHVTELTVTYEIVSEKDTRLSRERYVKLRKDHKGRWKVYDCDFSLFW